MVYIALNNYYGSKETVYFMSQRVFLNKAIMRVQITLIRIAIYNDPDVLQCGYDEFL